MKTPRRVSRMIGGLVGLAFFTMAGPGNASLIGNQVNCGIVSGDPAYSCVYATGGVVGGEVEFYVGVEGQTMLSLDLAADSLGIGFMATGSIDDLIVYLYDLYWADSPGGYIDSLSLSYMTEIDGFTLMDITLADGGHTIGLNFSGAYIYSGGFAQIDFGVLGHEPQPVPEPSILALFGIGLAGLGFLRRRRKLT